MPFVKLDTRMLTSSIWVDRDMRSLFVTALLMAEPFEVREPMPQLEVRSLAPTGWSVPPGWYGMVSAAGVGIIRTDGIDREEGLKALEALGSPDPESRSQGYDGRRLVRVDGGFIALNYMEYRDRDHSAAERQRRFRERKKRMADDNGNAVTERDDYVTSHIAEAEAEAEAASSSSSARDELLALVSNPGRWRAEMEAALQGMHGLLVTAAQLELACSDYLANGASDRPNMQVFRGYLRRSAAPASSSPSPGKRRGTIGERSFANAMRAMASIQAEEQ